MARAGCTTVQMKGTVNEERRGRQETVTTMTAVAEARHEWECEWVCTRVALYDCAAWLCLRSALRKAYLFQRHLMVQRGIGKGERECSADRTTRRCQ